MQEFIDKIRIRLIMIIFTAIVIIVIEILHLTGYSFLTPYRIIWEVLVMCGAYITPILLTEFNQHILPWNDVKSQVTMIVYAMLSPLIMLLGLIFLVFSILNRSNTIYFWLYLVNFAGFYLYSYAHKGEFFEEYQAVHDQIDEYKRDRHQY